MIPTTDLEQAVRHLGAQVAALSAEVDRLKNPKTNTTWMSINNAAKHPQIQGRMSAKQIRTRVLMSIRDPATAPFLANIHYQVVTAHDDQARYVVNAIELGNWLNKTTTDRYN